MRPACEERERVAYFDCTICHVSVISFNTEPMPKDNSITLNDPRAIPVLFSDSANSPVLHYDKFDLASAKRQIEDQGFVIAKGLVPLERIERVRAFWLKTFSDT